MVTERQGFVRSNEFARFEKGRPTGDGDGGVVGGGGERGGVAAAAAVAQIAGGLLR